MLNRKNKKFKERKGLIVFIVIVSFIVIFLLIQYILCQAKVRGGYERLKTYPSKEIELSRGTVTYIDQGEGDTILSVHGIFGGYDQAYDNAKALASEYRIIAPSRFGYLGSDVPEVKTPKEQARVFAELLDQLHIDKVYLFATSAGGTAAIRFALDYPDRTKGLVLVSSAMPPKEKPGDYSEYAGPPAFLINNFGMWLLRPFFMPMMGMESDVVYSMLPVNERREGSIIDASISNPDMARNFDEYKIENLQAPVLIFQAKDDKMAKYELSKQAVPRFPNHTFVVFKDGGHLLNGHEEEMDATLKQFLNDNR